MKNFHIVITDNETGKTWHDCDTDCIIGAFLEGDGEDEGTYQLALTSCNANGLLNTLSSAEGAISYLYKQHPELLIAKMLHESANSETEESEQTPPQKMH